jgi:EAL domain-containing protein (putative c-di-GMP-specific phosphodiesterase class I)
VDDFGTGYSSLGHLKVLPIDKLKIDRSFVSSLPGNGESVAVASAIVSLAKSLGLKTTAEGVETQGQFDALIKLGCIEFQGYLLGRPMSADAISAVRIQAKAS